MIIVSIIFWVLAIIAIILRFISKTEGHRYTEYLWAILVAFFTMKLIIQSIFESSKVSYPMEVLPLNLQILGIILSALWIKDAINSKKTEEFLANIHVQGGLALGGIGYIIGALFFGYYFAQYFTGLMLLASAFFFFYTTRTSSFSRFVNTTIIFTIFLLIYYSAMTFFVMREFSVHSVREILLNNPLIVIFMMFLAVNMRIRGAYSDKKFALITKVCISLVAASFLLRHPELKTENLKLFEDGLKYIVTSSDLGLVGYNLISVYKASKYLI